MNPRLRTIVADAKAQNMPRENIERAIRRGTGEEPGVSYEDVMYEGYGPGGVAILIETLTDNKNRTVGEIRHMLGKHAGNLAAENSVAWMFHRKGQIVIEKGKADEEKLLTAALASRASTRSSRPCSPPAAPTASPSRTCFTRTTSAARSSSATRAAWRCLRRWKPAVRSSSTRPRRSSAPLSATAAPKSGRSGRW